MIDDQSEGWLRWRPELAESGAYEDVVEGIGGFVPPCNVAGDECDKWLKSSSLEDYPYTATWILYTQGMVHGFFALHSSVVTTVIQDGDTQRREHLPCSQI